MKSGPSTENFVDDVGAYERFVQWIYRSIVLAMVLVFLSVAATTPTEWARYGPLVFLGLVLALSRWQGRRGPRHAVMVLVIGVWVMTGTVVLQFAGVHSASIILYPFTIGLAGWVLGKRWLLGMTVATAVFLSAVGASEMLGAFHPTARASTLVVTVQLVAVLSVIAFLAYTARQHLLNSRDRAISLSQELAAQNAAYAARERELQLLMDNVPVGVASFDAQSHLRRCNLRYATLFGAQPRDIVGHAIADYVPPLALSQLMPYWEKALAGVPQHYRRSNGNPDAGAVSWLDADVVPEIVDGKVVGLFALVVDVTQRVRAEQEIRDLNADLERRVEHRTQELALALDSLHASREELARSQAKAALSALVASVAHELSSPIGNSVLVASTFRDLARELLQQLESGQLRKSSLLELGRNLEDGSLMLQSNLSRAEALVKNFKQVAADQASEQRRSFDLAEVVAEVVASLRPSLKKSPHRVVQDIAPGIVMDSLPGPLGQVLINLINNAYMHAFEGRADGGLLTISANVQGESVLLRVADNGVGIADSVLQHLFEPFFSTKIGRGGTGLGMSIVDSIVRKALGGAITVQSVPGQGTVFDITLPLCLPQAKPA